MHEDLKNFEKYLHLENEFPPLVRLAITHYQFEAIHPFSDGNGRIGRLLNVLLMVHWNLLPLPLLYLSPFFEGHRQEYYDLLLNFSKSGRWREWIIFFLRGVLEQTKEATNEIKRLQDLQSEWRHRFTEFNLGPSALKRIDKLFDFPIISIRDVKKHLNISYPSAKRVVGKFIDAKILIQIGDSSYAKLFIAKDFFKDVKDWDDLVFRIKLLEAKH